MEVTSVRLTVYPEAKHDRGTEIHPGPKRFTWLLAQPR